MKLERNGACWCGSQKKYKYCHMQMDEKISKFQRDGFIVPTRKIIKNEEAAVKAESCGDCGTYLKILYQEKDPKVEAVADDLASLILDAKMEQEGFARSSINPFLFPGEGE